MADEQDTEDVEHELARDLGALAHDLHEDAFAGELYRGLAGRGLVRADGSGDRVALSWRRAEALVNGLRERAGAEPLELAQTGGESFFVTDRVERALDRCGWRARELDTSTHDLTHASDTSSPPPRGQGERDAPTEPPQAWREAYSEADRR